jgi:hypothetical protein
VILFEDVVVTDEGEKKDCMKSYKGISVTTDDSITTNPLNKDKCVMMFHHSTITKDN